MRRIPTSPPQVVSDFSLQARSVPCVQTQKNRLVSGVAIKDLTLSCKKGRRLMAHRKDDWADPEAIPHKPKAAPAQQPSLSLSAPLQPSYAALSPRRGHLSTAQTYCYTAGARCGSRYGRFCFKRSRISVSRTS